VERLVKQTQELEAKARGFHEQLRAFRERDKAINEALISAQQLRAEVREQADREAQLILREARAESERMLADQKQQIARVEADLDLLVRQRRAYLAQLRALVERQLAEITAAEASPSSLGPERPPSDESQPRPAPQTPAWLDSLVKE
jgi:cell division septum initiation protein DivIVA